LDAFSNASSLVRPLTQYSLSVSWGESYMRDFQAESHTTLNTVYKLSSQHWFTICTTFEFNLPLTMLQMSLSM
jgi:hypothetical protein